MSFDQDLAQLVRTLEPRVGHRIGRLLRRRPFVAAALVLVALLAGLWAYPHLALTPDRARIRIVEMKLDYDADTFVLLAGKNDRQAVALFLRAGTAPDAPNRRGETALMHAAGNGHLDLVRLLVDRGARIDRALVWSAGSGQREVLDYLLARAPSRHALGAALVAAAGQHPDIVRKLLDLGADVDFGEEEGARTALSEASRGGNLDAVLLLLERGANPNPALREGWSPLHHAIDSRHSDGDEPQSLLDIVRALLDKGADIEARTRSMANWRPTPLLLAIDRQLPRVTNLLIERGADIEAQTAFYGDRGQMLSPLMWASMEGSAEIVRTLLAKGANVDVRNDHGETALLVAADESPAFQAAIVETLLAAGAGVRARSNRGGTALTRAAQYDNGVLPILLKAGADTNAATHAGWTALMVAAEAGETENARRLLASGAKAELKNRDGEDAMVIAAKSDSKEIVRMLRENSMAARP